MERQGKTGGYLEGISIYAFFRLWSFLTRPFFILKEKYFRKN
jgi:hypothetical protein